MASAPQAHSAELAANPDWEYDVRQRNNQFKVTVNIDALTAAGITHRQPLAVGLTIDDGRLVIHYSGDIDSPFTTAATVRTGTGGVRIPSAIGNIADLGDETVTWSVIEDDGNRILRGATSKTLPEVGVNAGSILTANPLQHITQDIDSDDGTWTQEQFRLYLSTDRLSTLSWASNETVRLTLKQRNNRPALVVTPVTDSDADSTGITKPLCSTGPRQTDGLLTMPNALVHTLGLVNANLMWVASDRTLSAVPQSTPSHPF